MSKNIIGKVLLDQYRVEAFIASGGMGAVYRVWDLKRNVPLAMKVLHSELADDPHMFKRFKREANALKKLTHPHIVQFYGLFQTVDFAFLLERYIDGPSLKDILRQQSGKPLPVPETLTYLKALSAALGYAHANGVVHCDVKPGNVLVDQGGNVYLTDFGIARHAESTTTTMATAGTAAYMAPEQIRGETVTPATDIYALGVMLFEMLTGQRPYRGSEAGTEKGGDTANERIRYAHLHIPPPDPRSLNSSIPKELAEITLKAMDKDPARRYQTMQQFLEHFYTVTGTTFAQTTERVNVPRAFQETASSSRPRLDSQQQALPRRPDTSRKIIPWVVGVFALAVVGVVIAASANSANNPTLKDPTGTQDIPGVATEVPVNPPNTSEPRSTPTTGATKTPTPTVPADPNEPSGKIVFSCQIDRRINNDQICIINVDGSGFQQLTNNFAENYYPSLAPDGINIVFASKQTGNFEIYEMDLNGNQQALTSGLGELSAPDISPDGELIVFTNNTSNLNRIWVMNRNGSNPHEVYSQSGRDSLDPVWSPDGNQILFAIGRTDDRKLHIINKDGSDLKQIDISLVTRGRSDWSPDRITIATYSGEPWHREIFLLNVDGADVRQISNGGNVLAPSFSPNGEWIAFTGYIDNYGNDNGCEIYIMRIDGTDVRRLTNNDYCDWQPRWGP